VNVKQLKELLEEIVGNYNPGVAWSTDRAISNSGRQFNRVKGRKSASLRERSRRRKLTR
jgi:hypothetical protein